MRLHLATLAAIVVAASPLAAAADPGPGVVCVLTINSKGVHTTVCDPLGGPGEEADCAVVDPGAELWPVVPYVKVCFPAV